MKPNNPKSISGRGKWATALSAIAISLLAWTASAKDEVPFKGTTSGYPVAGTTNPDGSQDLISREVGVSTHAGRYTGVSEVKVDAPDTGVFDPETRTVAIHFTGSGRDVGLDI